MDEKPTPEAPGPVTPAADAPATGAGGGDGPDLPAAREIEGPPKRRKGPLIAVIAVVLVVAGVIGVLGYNALSARLAARADMERALELVTDADETVLALDDIVLAEITLDLAPRARATSEAVPAALADIQEALELLDGALDDLNDEDRQVALALAEAGAGRVAMLQEAPELLRANEQASMALKPAAEGLEEILAAQKLSNDAAAKFNLQTKEGVTASTEFTNQALEKLQEAKQSFQAAQEVFPEADMSAFIAYAKAKGELLEDSLEIDETWLAGKLTDANKLVDAYNDKDEEVSKLGEGLPESETVPIAEAYEEVTAEATSRYMVARSIAARADTRLRMLLGEDAASTETSATASDVDTGTASDTETETTDE